MFDLKTKSKIDINNIAHEFEIYQMDDGIITGFKFDGRVFLDIGVVNKSLDLLAQMSKSNFFEQQSGEGKVNKKKPELEVPQTIPSGTSQTVPDETLQTVPKPKKDKWPYTSKVCTKCNKMQPLTEFYKSTKYKDGHVYICKTCASIYSKKHYKDKIKEPTKKSVITFVQPNENRQSPQLSEPVVVQPEQRLKPLDQRIKITEEKSKSPDNTSLFLHWLADGNRQQFDIRDFVNAFPGTITMETATSIVAHQISKHKIAQLTPTTFRVGEIQF